MNLRAAVLCGILFAIASVHGESENKPQDGKFVNWFLEILGVTATTTEAAVKVCRPCDCGLTNENSKIVNGSEVKSNKYSWMAYLTYRGHFLCGATLINDQYLLTSAHGIELSKMSSFKAIFLNYDRSTILNRITRRIVKIVKHKHFGRKFGLDNDIALLKMDRSIGYDVIKPICLPLGSIEKFEGQFATVLGFGAKDEFQNYSTLLQETSIPVWSNEACSKTDYSEKITDNMLCAGYPEGGKDACKGDSGGPLQIKIDNAIYLIGIVSWGESCAKPNSPGVYTRVSNYLEWIANNTQDACFCV